jgi:putative SOS response-associated peptidase YedK
MCSHYQAIKERERYAKHFGVEPPLDMGKHDVWPCYPATFIRRPKEADVGDEAVPDREALPGLFGLIPHWATDANIGRQTYNAHGVGGEQTQFQGCLEKRPALHHPGGCHF